MIRLATLLIAILVVLAGACGNEDPTEPPVTDPFTQVATESVGPAGGTLSGSGFSLVVPAGALASVTVLSLAVASDAGPLGGQAVTTLFRIEGLPVDFASDLELQVGHDEPLAGDAYLALGKQAVDPESGQAITGYQFLPATAAGGLLNATLSPGSSPPTKAKADAAPPVLVQGVTGVEKGESSGGHFVIRDLSNLWSFNGRAETLLGFLEDAYTTLTGLGFTHASLRDWPVEVTIRPSTADEYFGVRFVPDWRSDDWGILEVAAQYGGNDALLRQSVGDALLRLVASLYDPRWQHQVAGSRPDHYWLNVAAETWAGKFFTDEEPYMPIDLPYHGVAPFLGFHAGALDGDAYNHGTGMSVVLEQQLNGSAQNRLAAVYERIRQGDHVTQALRTGFGDPDYWISPFFTAYITGQVYSASIQEWAILWEAATRETWIVGHGADTEKTFSYPFQNLSARIFRINLRYPDLHDQAQIRFEIPEGTDSWLNLFKIHPGSIEFIGSGNGAVVDDELRDYYDQGYDILVVVSNCRWAAPHDQSRLLDLEVTITSPLPGERIYVDPSLSVSARYQKVWNDPPGGGTVQVSRLLNVSTHTEGNIVNQRFETDFEHNFPDGERHWGHILVTFNGDRSTLTRLELTKHSAWPDSWNHSHVTTSVVVAENLPRDNDLAGFVYEFRGTATCGGITSLTETTVDRDYTETLIVPHTCREESYITVKWGLEF